MSIKNQIERIQSNVTASLAAVAEKGVAVASDSTSDDLPSLISSISTQGVASCAVNLLDNSDFTNTINQRGQTIYSTAGQYTFDRWVMGADVGGMVAVGDGYIGMNASSGYVDIEQIFERASFMTGKAYTLAVMLNGASAPCLMNFTFGTNTSVSFNTGIDGGLIHHNGDRIIIRVSNTGSSWVSFLWAALYEGTYTADTLPEYIPKGYDVELLACKRYFESVHGTFVVAANQKTLVSMRDYSPKRIVPTFNFGVGDLLTINRPGVGTATITVKTVDAYAEYFDHISVNESLTFGDSCILHYTVSADL